MPFKEIGKLLQDHHQDGCEMVPAGSEFIILGERGSEIAALFSKDILPDVPLVFKDGHVRILDRGEYEIIRRER